MNCSEARRRFSACLDRDLTFAEDEELRRHLRECPTCSQEMACLERVQGMLRDLPETQPDPGFYETVCRRIAEEQAGVDVRGVRARAWSGGFLKEALASIWLRPALGAAFGLAIGLLIHTGGGPANTPGNLDAGGLQATSETASGADQATLPTETTTPAAIRTEGPLADLSLPDSTREYIRDPYERDQQGKPVRMQRVDANPNDGHITF